MRPGDFLPSTGSTAPARWASVLTIVASAALACRQGEASMSPSELAIRSARADFNAAIARHDTAGIASHLLPDYQVVTGRSAHFGGLDANRRNWADMFARDSTVTYVRAPREVRVNESWGLAEELGDWRGHYLAGASTVRANGTYAAKWQRVKEDHWKLQVEVFTTMGCEGPPAGCVPPDPVPPDQR